MADPAAFELSPLILVLIAATAFLGSALTAAFSIGGGLLLIAVMSALLPPVAVIPVHAVVMTGSNVGRSALLIRHVAWPIVGWFALGAVAGGLVGAQVVFSLPPAVLRLAIAAFILFTQWGPQVRLPLGAPFYALAGGLSMFLTLFVGASGPFITAILSRLPGFSRMALIATAGACMTLQHSGKAAIFGLAGFDYGVWLGLIGAALVSGFAGTFLGTRILKSLDERLFRRALKTVLTGLAGWLVVLALSE